MKVNNFKLSCSQKLPNGNVEEHVLVSCQGESFVLPTTLLVERIQEWLQYECVISNEFNFTLEVKL